MKQNESTASIAITADSDEAGPALPGSVVSAHARARVRAAFRSALVVTLVATVGCSALSFPDPDPEAPANDSRDAKPSDAGSEAQPQASEATNADAASAVRQGPLDTSWTELAREGRYQVRIGDYTAAETSFFAALQATHRASPTGPRVRAALGNLVRLTAIYQREGRFDDAGRVIDRLQVEAANGRRADPKNFVPVMSLQGEHLTAGGNPEAAVELLESAAVWSEGQGRVSRTERSLLIERLGQAYLEAGRFDEASERFQAIRSDVESQFGPESEAMALAQIDIARLQDRQGHSDAAEDTWRWAIDIQAQKAPTSTQLARMRHEFALFLLRQGRDLEAAEQASSAAAVVAKRRSQVRLYATCLYTVATASALTQDDERAEESMRAAITALEQTGSSGRSLRIEIMRAYVRFLRERGRNDEADAGDAWLAAELGEVAPAATDEPPAD